MKLLNPLQDIMEIDGLEQGCTNSVKI